MLAGENTSSRGRRRSHNACLPCRRKKTRCPGEKPACSSCTRLKQQCSYAPVTKSARGGRSEERLASLEAKLDRILNGNSPNQTTPSNSNREQQPSKDADGASQRSFSHSPNPDRDTPGSRPSTDASEPPSANPNIELPDIVRAIHIYFKHCHRQPIWCFEREDVSDFRSLPDELSCSILALTSRFFQKGDRAQRYGNDARRLIMLRIANGTVALTTIESLCLLSYSFFIDGNAHLGQFHLGLAVQLCQAAMLDLESMYAIHDPTTERKKRLYWSLQVLEQFYGRFNNVRNASVMAEVGRPFHTSAEGIPGLYTESGPKTPPLPGDDRGFSALDEPGIWNTGVHLGWIWSRVRKYVSDCSQNILKEPWRHDSMYATVQSDFLETENRIPICHRYDSVRFYDRKVEELRMNHDYWAAWLREQFTYHAIPTVLNHPFLYIVGAQHNPNLGIPNTFWRRSSELALLHATWIVRIIDMAVEKEVQLTDPFFGHAAAIAATVHLYYCCAAATQLKHKSNTDFEKCRKFLKTFLPFSAACAALDRNLDNMTRIATGSDNMDSEDWMPSKIYLSIPLMWDILQFNCTTESREIPTADLLDSSLSPKIAREEPSESSTLEILVATSPEINVDTTNGGQDAPSLSRRGPMTGAGGAGAGRSETPRGRMAWNATTMEQPTDNLTFNTTPWLYADPLQFGGLSDLGWHDSQSTISDTRSSSTPWWEGGMLSNSMSI